MPAEVTSVYAPVVTHVIGCARCSDAHGEVEFRPLKQSVRLDDGGEFASHWAICPTTGEPILLLHVLA